MTKPDERRNNQRLREAIDAILEERDYQLQRWTVEDDRAKTPEEWLSVLTMYMGKLAMETPQYQMGNFSMERFRKRVKQIAAIGAAILEATGHERSDDGRKG